MPLPNDPLRTLYPSQTKQQELYTPPSEVMGTLYPSRQCPELCAPPMIALWNSILLPHTKRFYWFWAYLIWCLWQAAWPWQASLSFSISCSSLSDWCSFEVSGSCVKQFLQVPAKQPPRATVLKFGTNIILNLLLTHYLTHYLHGSYSEWHHRLHVYHHLLHHPLQLVIFLWFLL